MFEDNLNKRQLLFVEAYLANDERNGTKAAGIAGYSGNDAALAVTANRLLKNVKVRAKIGVITEVIDQAVAENIAHGVVELQQFWADLMDGKIPDSKLIVHRDGTTEIVEVPASIKDRTRGSELLGKSKAAFTEKIEVQGRIENVDKRRQRVDRSLDNPQARKAMRALYAATKKGDDGESTRH